MCVAVFHSPLLQGEEIRLSRVDGKNVRLESGSKAIVVPQGLLQSHLQVATELHTWWFDNKYESWRFARIAKAKPSSRPMTVPIAVDRRVRRERAKITSFIEFYCEAKHGQSSCENPDIKKLRALGKRLNTSFSSQAEMTEINRLLLASIDELLTLKKGVTSSAIGTIQHSVLKSYFRSPATLEFVAIPGRSYEIQKTELTQSEWYSVLGTNPSFFSDREDCEDSYSRIREVELCPDYPVETFRYAELLVLLKKLNFQSRFQYRIPTNSEWEFAARAGSKTRFFFGENESRASEFAWSHQVFASHPTNVGSLKPNPWGLYDVHGNLWELVIDDRSDENKPDKGYATRGGSWFEFAARLSFDGPGYRIHDDWTCYDVGIRLAR